jgi:hypothetical protein
MAKQETAGVGECGGGCSVFPRILVPKPCVIEPGSLTPRQAAQVMHDAGTYGDWVEDVPIQGPTDRDIRTADCWWKNHVLDKATDEAGRIVPQWTQNSLCIGNRLTNSGVGGVGETIRRGGALGQSPAASPAVQPSAGPAGPPPGIWSKLADAEAHWIASTIIQLNALILKAGNKPCTAWPADLLQDDATAIAKMPAAVACFQGWFNLNGKPKTALRTDGVLDESTACALMLTAGQHPADFPTPYPGVLRCGGLPLSAKVGLGALALAAVGGTVAAVAGKKKKRAAPSAPPAPVPAPVGEARRRRSARR